MRPTDLFEGTDAVIETAAGGDTAGTDSIEIAGLTADSRQVNPGDLFAAVPGTKLDGRAFLADALANGAVAVLAPKGTELPAGDRPVALIATDNVRRALAIAAARFYGRQPDVVAAVTGTNGKTSVASFARQIWTHAGERAASLGTLGLVPEDAAADSPGKLTTPDPVALHRCLAQLARGGTERLAIEASSHGLDQDRLDGLRVSAAAFTNLTQDHLDYHADMDRYLAAKLRLFAELLVDAGTAVVNADSGYADRVIRTCRQRNLRIWTYGEAAGADLRLAARHPELDAQRLELELFGTPASVRLPLVGGFQASNALAALGLGLAGGLDRERALAALEHLQGVPGRMQQVAKTPAGAPVFVDYAHTPDALETVLQALRPHARDRLVCVFGCGGDRDRAKRPQMGAIAARLAELAIVTDDNPRGEDPAAIRAEVLQGAPDAVEIGDRARAIADAVARLGPGDVLLIAGKGHETGQIVGDRCLPFDDAEVARAAVAQLEAGAS